MMRIYVLGIDEMIALCGDSRKTKNKMDEITAVIKKDSPRVNIKNNFM